MANWYVDENGDDGGAGSIGDPFASWRQADSVANNGDTIYINSGDYTHTYTTETIAFTSHTITVRGNGATRPRINITWSGSISSGGIRPSTNSLIQNLDLKLSCTYAGSIHFIMAQASGVVIKNCGIWMADTIAQHRFLFGRYSSSFSCPTVYQCSLLLTRATSGGVVLRHFFASAVTGATFFNNIYGGQFDYLARGETAEGLSATTSDYCFVERILMSDGDTGEEDDTFGLRAGLFIDYSLGTPYYRFFGDMTGFTDQRIYYIGSGTFNGGAGGITITFKNSPSYPSNEIESMINSGFDTGNWVKSNLGTAIVTTHTDGGNNIIGSLEMDDVSDSDWWDDNFSTPTPCENTGDPSVLNPDSSRSHIGVWGGPDAFTPPTPPTPTVTTYNGIQIVDSVTGSNGINCPLFPSRILGLEEENDEISSVQIGLHDVGAIQVLGVDYREFTIEFDAVRKGDAESGDPTDLTSIKIRDIFTSRLYISRGINIDIQAIGTVDDGYPYPETPLTCRILDVSSYKDMIPNSIGEVLYKIVVKLQRV